MPTNIKRAIARQTRSHQQEMVQLLPDSWLEKFVDTKELDKWSKKLFFGPFIRFLLLIILKQTRKISLRRLSHATKDPYYQRATGIRPVEFSNIGMRLRKIPRTVWEEVFLYCYRLSQSVDNRFKQFSRLLKWFDTTTISMSVTRCPWAADNGVKNAVRVALRCDDRAERIELIVNGCANTNDNTIFQQLLINVKKGAIFVFDAGFHSLSIIKETVSRGYHFISVKSASYFTWCVKLRSLPEKCLVTPDWEVIKDCISIVGVKDNPGRNRYRVLVFRNLVTQELLTLFTNLRGESPKKLFAMYHRRWRIEVIFRWLKNEFALDHIPAFNEAGVWAWIFLNLIAFLLLRYWQLKHQPMTSIRKWSSRDAFGWFQQQFNNYFFQILLIEDD